MKKISKILLTSAILCLFFALSGFPSYAVPAKPGSTCEGDGRCHSSTAETPVTMEVLAERDRLKEEKAKENNSDEGGMVAGITRDQTERTLSLLCIVIGFNGKSSDAPNGLPYSQEYDWGEYIFRSEESLTRYYKEMSLGKFTFVPAEEISRYGVGGNKNKSDKTNDGIIHVTVDQPHLDWSTLPKIDNTEMYRLLSEAVKKAAPYVNVSGFEVDGDGMIDNNELAISFILAGYDPSTEPEGTKMGAMNYLWPHAYTFHDMEDNVSGFTYPELNGLKLDRYICMSEKMIDQNYETVQAPLSTLFHELGHYLGLPDLYNTVDTAFGEWCNYDVGKMSLMAGGCWGVTPDGGDTVYSLDMWSRYYLGWMDAELITESGTYTVSGDDLSEETETPRLYRIDGANKGEYYLIENHRLSNWDKYLNYGLAKQLEQDSYSSDGGIVIWHIDDGIIKKYQWPNEVNGINHRPGIMPIYPEESSDSDFRLISNVKDGDVKKDPFYVSATAASKKLTLALPAYGSGTDANKRMGRVDTSTKISFTGSSADKMQFSVTFRKNVWEKADGKWTYIGKDGQKVTGWQKIKNKWYYFDSNGIMYTGWLKSGGKWYYLTGSGAMKTGWLKSGGKWYYFTGSGVMKTGWLKTGGKWYYFTGSGVMKTGWLKDGDKWYYFSSSGAMVTGNLTIGKKIYRFNTAGVCLNP